MAVIDDAPPAKVPRSTTDSAPDSAAEVDAAGADDFVVRVRHYADSVLRPAALRTDREGVPASRVGELAGVNLLNHLAPKEFGGADLGRGADRRVHEVLSGACFNTWLVWAQHAPMAGRLAKAHAKGAELSPLALDVLRGRLLLGAAISDVRRYPDHHIRAVRTPGGWRVSGTISWVSGWGLNSALTVAAVEDATETVVTALVPIGERITATHLELSAVGGSRTERVDLDDVFVPDADVIETKSLEKWRVEDFDTASDARPQHFGLAEAVLAELDSEPDPLARAVAAGWGPRVAQIRADAYGLSDEAKQAGGGAYRLDDRLAVKTASGEALSVLTRALLVARSGHGLGRDDTAQLYARSALFVLVQGQNSDVRRAQLTHLGR